MHALPQVGQKYQHKKWGEVFVKVVAKCGRGHSVVFEHGPELPPGWDGEFLPMVNRYESRKDFQKATA